MQASTRRVTLVLLSSLLVPASTFAQDPTEQPAAAIDLVDIAFSFTATDGTPLEAKLSLPARAETEIPVVFYLHGAGPRTVDNALQYRDADGSIRTYRFYDFHARELARRGMAFFRINKRGSTAEPSGRPVVDRDLFSGATPSVLLDDYARALEVLRARSEIDRNRILLLGSSEGTRLAPQLASRAPQGIAGLALMSYQSVNMRETVIWQTTNRLSRLGSQSPRG